MSVESNPCFWSAVTVTMGAVAAFFAALGIVTRSAYQSGFRAGIAEASERFEKIIKLAKAEELFRGMLDDSEGGSDAR